MKKLIAEKQLEQKKKGSKIIYAIITLFVLLSVVRIFVANRLVDYSQKLHEMEIKENELLVENSKLSLTYAKLSSLVSLKEKALNSGFVETTKISYIDHEFLYSFAGFNRNL
ncbi:MAG: hypothetical protein Q7S14_01520 [bacterium]|nr:hypothetical protein [bacterium]